MLCISDNDISSSCGMANKFDAREKALWRREILMYQKKFYVGEKVRFRREIFMLM
jgi:hypothetical protein